MGWAVEGPNKHHDRVVSTMKVRRPVTVVAAAGVVAVHYCSHPVASQTFCSNGWSQRLDVRYHAPSLNDGEVQW